MQTTAAVLRSAEADFALEDVRLDAPRPDEVLVRIEACGVCHMDIEAKELMETPCILGHEGAGVVVETGSQVETVAPGDRVILGYGHCGHCGCCENDQPYFCDLGWDLTFGGRREDGTSTAFGADGEVLTAAFFQQSSFARHAITPGRCVVKIADDVPWHVAAAIPCGFMTGVGSAQNVLRIEDRSSLLVAGVGAVGIGAIVGASAAGCDTIIAADIKPERLALAREFGATETIDATEVGLAEWCAENLPRGCSHALDTTGSAKVFEALTNCLATGGEMAYAILPSPMEEFSFKPFQLFVRCASLKAVSFGSADPRDLLPTILDWWRSGRFPVERLIRTYGIEDINDAIAAGKCGDVVKPVLLMRSETGSP